MTAIQTDICDTQGELYAYAAERGYAMEEFSDAYLSSDFCLREMDAPYSRFQTETPAVCMDALPEEIRGPGKYPENRRFDENIARWIGFTYRQMAFVWGKTGKEVLSLLPFGSLLAAYPGLHTVDEELAGELMTEDLRLKG